MIDPDRQAFREAVYGPMSDEEVQHLRQSAGALLNETERLINDGSTQMHDGLAGSFERILDDTEVVLLQRRLAQRSEGE